MAGTEQSFQVRVGPKSWHFVHALNAAHAATKAVAAAEALAIDYPVGSGAERRRVLVSDGAQRWWVTVSGRPVPEYFAEEVAPTQASEWPECFHRGKPFPRERGVGGRAR